MPGATTELLDQISCPSLTSAPLPLSNFRHRKWLQDPEGGREEKRLRRREDRGQKRVAMQRDRDREEDDGCEEEGNGRAGAQRTGPDAATGLGKH